MIAEIVRYFAALVMLVGAIFGLLAAIGILRLPDFYTRIHAASKAGAVGAGLILIAIALAEQDGSIALRAMLGLAFLLLTTPVSAHLLARAALKSGLPPTSITNIDEMPSQATSTKSIL